MGKTACFTGPRAKKLFGYTARLYAPLQTRTEQVILNLLNAGFTDFISGGAQGFDQTAFKAVRAVQKDHPEIRNIVHVVEDQEKVWPETSPFGQKDFRDMLAAADEVKTIKKVRGKTPGQLLNDRNMSMLNTSELVIAAWPKAEDWTDATRSGTANMLRAATAKQTPIVILDPFAQGSPYRNDIGA